MQYPRLFSPLRLGAHTLRNRVVFTAHLTNSARGGLPTVQHAAYYAARAAGGVGMIVTEEHCVHPSDWPYEKVIHGYRPDVVDGYRTITDAVHAHGTVIVAQLNHNGGQGSGMYSRRPLLAPSPIPDPLFREVPKQLTHNEIDELVDAYASVARRCRDGGFDGVEVQCSQSSLIRGFLASGTNLRTDDYGGPLANRARFLLEVIAAVRAAVGPDAVVGVRLTGDERIAGGIVPDEAVATARLVAATGTVDYVNTTMGMATASLHLVEPSMATPRGYALHIAAAMREAIDLPVIGVGRIKEPAEAEQALADGRCDLVGVVRGQIADPEFVEKARRGAGDIRTCLSCNQECVGRMGLGRWLGCVENPRAGRESVPLPIPAIPGRRVIVVGGGPAGLSVASTAAERGHRVMLYERSDRVGGQNRVAASAAGRGELGELTRNLERACVRAGVRIVTGKAMTVDTVLAEAPDVVVVATGARPVRPWWAGEYEHVVHAREVLAGTAAPRGRVLVVDELGFQQGPSTAETLAARGCTVTIATPAMIVGQDLGVTLDTEGWQRRAHRAGIAAWTDVAVARPVEVVDAGVRVTLANHLTGTDRTEVFDAVVCATHQEPDDGLWKALSDNESIPFEVYRIGDAVTPRRAHAAVLEGHRVAVGL